MENHKTSTIIVSWNYELRFKDKSWKLTDSFKILFYRATLKEQSIVVSKKIILFSFLELFRNFLAAL